MAWGQEKGADFHISALRACQYEIFDFVPCSLPLKTLILLTFSCFLIRRREKDVSFLLVRYFCFAKVVACGRVTERERGNPSKVPPSHSPFLAACGSADNKTCG